MKKEKRFKNVVKKKLSHEKFFKIGSNQQKKGDLILLRKICVSRKTSGTLVKSRLRSYNEVRE